MARLLTQGLCEAKKEALASPHTFGQSSVLVGVGHAGVGEELMWRHLERCASKQSNPFAPSASLRDDFSAGPAGSVITSDFSAFDETASFWLGMKLEN